MRLADRKFDERIRVAVRASSPSEVLRHGHGTVPAVYWEWLGAAVASNSDRLGWIVNQDDDW